MPRFAGALLVLALLPSLTGAETVTTPRFADIAWGASADAVVRAATDAGLRLVGQDRDGDFEFEGTLFEAAATVYAYMSPDRGLVKVQVRLASPNDESRQHYGRIVDALAQQYGATERVEIYRLPYRQGDGREDEAVRLGKGLLYATWGDDLHPGQAALVVRATKRIVGLDYESHDWSAEADRRQRLPQTLLREAGAESREPDDEPRPRNQL